jgi:AGCS family alanine or glycine:cation symporter
MLPAAFREFLQQFARKQKKTEPSGYRALCTALAATVGTGNIVGVAGAITIGGPGALFWMWVCAVFGMILKFAEATLAVRYRVKNPAGEYVGGTMYMIQQGMGSKWKLLATIYCLFGTVAAFGVGNTTQLNAILMSVDEAIAYLGGNIGVYLHVMIAVGIAALTAIILLGGANRISAAAEKIVPVASVCYLVMCFAVIVLCSHKIPGVVISVFKGAIDPKSVTGGALGSAFIALRIGASRGTFTNEAGMGTAAIAHAGAKVSHAVEQGRMGIVEVFLDTIVICTMTAFAILCSGIYIPYGADTGNLLTGKAFTSVLGGWSIIPLTIAICSFAFATIIGWSMYGARCAQFLFGERSWRWFVYIQVAIIILGSCMTTPMAWLIAETLNGLMAIPNLIALMYLSPELLRLIKEAGAQKVLRRRL